MKENDPIVTFLKEQEFTVTPERKSLKGLRGQECIEVNY